jgi:hypothetical protein
MGIHAPNMLILLRCLEFGQVGRKRKPFGVTLDVISRHVTASAAPLLAVADVLTLESPGCTNLT